MLIPYLFKGGTKARALEVNENFNEVQKSVEENEENIFQLQSDIVTKANKTGDESVIFAVATANTPLGATNLQQVQTMIAPFLPLINGLNITRTNDSNVYTVNSGACYDSTYKYVIQLAGSLPVFIHPQEANVVTNIFITRDILTTTPPQLVTTTDEVSPILPTQTTVYRKIGRYYTNMDNELIVQMVGVRTDAEALTNV